MRIGLFVVFLIVATLGNGVAKTPILIIPGYTGSQLQGTVSEGVCASRNPTTLWVDVWAPHCVEELELTYNSGTNKYSNRSGVNVMVPGFGDTSTVECLVNSTAICEEDANAQYFKIFVDYFVARGYQRGVTIRAAPYDWRLAADSLAKQGYFDQVKKLAEEMFNTSGERVALVAHSMGGQISLYFLNQAVSAQWKAAYIKVYIPLSGDFAGSSWALESVSSATLPSAFSPSLARSFESLYWLMPQARVYKDMVLIETPTGSYNASQYDVVFIKLAGYPIGWTKYKPTSEITSLASPGVTTYCFYGSDLATPQTYKFSSDKLSEKPAVLTGEGDGLVNRVSLEACLFWAGTPGFHHTAFSGVSHVDMVKSTTVLEAVSDAVFNEA